MPMAVVFAPDGDGATQQLVTKLHAFGFAVAAFSVVPTAEQLAKEMAGLRQGVRIDQGAVHAVIAYEPERAIAALLANRHEFQSFTLTAAAAEGDSKALERLRTRRVRIVPGSKPHAVATLVNELHRERAPVGPAAAIARTLDSFHDAAAVADEDRYFAILPDDAVFLGTDATERWTGKEFRAFAMRYFQRKSAWTYVPLERHIRMADGGGMAWFDEVLDNKGYGECRGTGVLAQREGRWVLLHYNLTVPVPNDLMGDVARQIRAHESRSK